jgi:hypothetical protein
MSKAVNFTTPVGRLVMGSTDKPQTTDADGKPLLVKNGPNQGKPTQKYFIAVAIPKNPGETHWAQTPWGKLIWEIGHAAFPNVAASPSFAWKVQDGDSTVPNKKGSKPVDREGFRGHWVMMMASTFPIKCYNRDGSAAVPPESIKPGYYVQVSVMCAGNDSAQNPGVYLNPQMVALSAFGEEIVFGPDPTQAGFGQGALPPGASLTPPAGMAAGVAPTGAPPPPAAAPASAYPAPVVPNPAILAPAAPPPPPAAPAAPAAPTGPQMTAKAGGVPYASFIAQGWNDDALRANGFIV